MHRFVIYGLVDPRTDQIRYIGQSRNGLQRARSHSCPSVSRSDRNRHKFYWIRELKDLGLRFEVRVLGSFDTVDVLNDHERWAIAYGRACGWPLTNILDGGDCTATFRGRKHKPETIEKMRAAHRGREFSTEHRAKLSAAKIGSKASPETRAKLSAMRKGYMPIPKEALARAWQRAREPKPYMADANKRRVWTDEMREKIAASRRGKPTTGKRLEFAGEVHSIAEWSRKTGIPYRRLRDRIEKLKWPLARALSVAS
jgi:hypothetical protein